MRLILWLLMFIHIVLFAQPLQKDMPIFAERRQVFMEKLPPEAMAILPSRPVYLRNLDVEYPYRQESNFYYLSGFEEPHSILVINPSHPEYKYVLFVQKKNRRRETYEGKRAGVEGAMKVFQADTAFYIDEFPSKIHFLIKRDRPLYYTFGINPEIDARIRTLFIERRSSGNWPIHDPAPILAEMRLIKNEGDWKSGLQKAIDISVQAHLEAMKSIVPGMFEYEIQAVFEYVFRKMGSPCNGYPCIIGSGPNSCTLHYSANDRRMQAGELVLMDCGAEYGYYSADITRTVPVSGKFTREQKEIYQIVLEAQKAAMRLVKPGVEKKALDDAIDEVLGQGLVKLGLIKDKKHHRIFTLHGYSHWIGLEVHDVGGYSVNGKPRILEPGMVFTIEPGIYVRSDVFDKMRENGYSESDIDRIRPIVEKYKNIGVRIEDDVLVTETGYKNLTAGVPREIEDIEKLMTEEGIGNFTM